MGRLAGKLDGYRLQRLGRFVGGMMLHLIWWDIVMNRPLLRWLRPAPLPRWQRWARAYRELAVEMGGVLVKLGQFMSLRLDILPLEVAHELAALQDQMPSVPLATVAPQIEADLQRPLAALFAWVSPEPVASASLAQVHLARLHTGEQVVVKVLRPGVLVEVETDLAAVGVLFRVLRHFPQLREQTDLDRLADEFIRVSLDELDLQAEGRKAERFARDFAQESQVYIPKVYWPYSGRYTLTMENVAYIKITNVSEMEAAGIDRRAVARVLYQLYLQQIFVNHFVHGDPHPGNLFVKPLPHPEERRDGFLPGEAVPFKHGRPFQVVFIDFGMSVALAPDMLPWLREFMIGLGTRDARRIVRAYEKGGLLREGADPAEVEAFTRQMLNDFGDTFALGQMPDMRQARTVRFLEENESFLARAPVTFDADLLFVQRAMGIVGGLVRQLDPDFDLWRTATPFAYHLLWEEWSHDWQARLQKLAGLGQALLTQPMPMEQVISQAQELFEVPDGFLMPLPFPPTQGYPPPFAPPPAAPAPVALSGPDRQRLESLEQSVRHLGWAVATLVVVTVGAVSQLVLTMTHGTEKRDGSDR